ncbi:MAG: YdeI/OmpD-associated family protein [bacterium]
MESDSTSKKVWMDITPLARNEWICWVTSAKKDVTRKHRIIVGLDKMRKGMRRPCCWAGCPHR